MAVETEPTETVLTAESIERRYRGLAAYRAGHLPSERGGVDRWLQGLAADAAGADAAALRPSVLEVRELIERDALVRMYANEMIVQVPPAYRHGVEDVDQLLARLNAIVTTAPQYDSNKDRRITFPMSALFVYMMMTPAGEALFRHLGFNEAIRGVLTDWCAFLDSPQSKAAVDSWLTRPARNEFKLEDFVTEPGFTSYNDFFHRAIRLDRRPLDAGDDIVVSANDGEVYRVARDVKASDTFWLKGQPYSLKDMFDGVGHEDFVGGTVVQSFLSGADYHRWHAPVGGKVLDQRIIPGLLFSELESAGDDPTAGTYSQGYGASVNTRGLIVIEQGTADGEGVFVKGKVGKVAVLPIGITEISSVRIGVRKDQVVGKGDEIGWFSYGGSSVCLVFQNKNIDFADGQGWAVDHSSLLMVRSRIGKLRTGG